MIGSTKSTVVMAEYPDGSRLLILEIGIDCPQCGRFTIKLLGHHLRLVRDTIIEAIDLYPELAKEEKVVKEDRTRFAVEVPVNPEVN